MLHHLLMLHLLRNSNTICKPCNNQEVTTRHSCHTTHHTEQVSQLLSLLPNDVCHPAALNVRLENGQVDKGVAVGTAHNGNDDTNSSSKLLLQLHQLQASPGCKKRQACLLLQSPTVESIHLQSCAHSLRMSAVYSDWRACVTAAPCHASLPVEQCAAAD